MPPPSYNDATGTDALHPLTSGRREIVGARQREKKKMQRVCNSRTEVRALRQGRGTLRSDERGKPQSCDPRHLLEALSELSGAFLLDAPREFREDSRAVVAFDREDERKAELGDVARVELVQLRQLFG